MSWCLKPVPSQRSGDQIPVECRACATGNTLDKRVEQQCFRVMIRGLALYQIESWTDPQCFHVRHPELATELRGFRAMKLQQIETHPADDVAYLICSGIDEQADSGHEWRKRADDEFRLSGLDKTRARPVKNQADGMGTRMRSEQGILDSGDPADLDGRWHDHTPIRLAAGRTVRRGASGNCQRAS